jgi:hypothetical protein
VLAISFQAAVLFIAGFGGLLALWAVVIQRQTPPEEAVPRTILSTSHVGRIAFAVIALAFIVLGLIVRSADAIVGAVAFILAAAGQHWVHERWRR